MLVDVIRNDMVQALKNGEKERKNTLSVLVSALDLSAKEKRDILTEEEEFSVLRKEVKQTKETLETSPKDRVDIIEVCKNRLAVIESYLPKLLERDEIQKIIADVLMDLNISEPKKSDKGNIMKVLMPKVKGKADGKLVNQILEEYLN